MWPADCRPAEGRGFAKLSGSLECRLCAGFQVSPAREVGDSKELIAGGGRLRAAKLAALHGLIGRLPKCTPRITLVSRAAKAVVDKNSAGLKRPVSVRLPPPAPCFSLAPPEYFCYRCFTHSWQETWIPGVRQSVSAFQPEMCLLAQAQGGGGYIKNVA
jgi:hypothetical protein